MSRHPRKHVPQHFGGLSRHVEKPPVYDDSANKTMSAMEEEELLKLMGKK